MSRFLMKPDTKLNVRQIVQQDGETDQQFALRIARIRANNNLKKLGRR